MFNLPMLIIGVVLPSSLGVVKGPNIRGVVMELTVSGIGMANYTIFNIDDIVHRNVTPEQAYLYYLIVT